MPRQVSSTFENSSNNVIAFPSFGKPITWVDQGIFFDMNTRTEAVHSIFQLVYEDAWHLYQLECNDEAGEIRWTLLTGDEDYILKSMTSVQIRHHFAKPEYAEPRGAWQVIHNSKFGFGKFTPLQTDDPIRYAMLVFVNGEMLMPILIHKVEDDVLLKFEELFN
jgi:hypothetical protein